MNIRLIASAVIAALLFTGTGAAIAAPADPQQATPAAAQPAETPAVQELTAEEAQAIALEHAELSADQVTGLKAKKDRENGVLVWEVESCSATKFSINFHIGSHIRVSSQFLDGCSISSFFASIYQAS